MNKDRDEDHTEKFGARSNSSARRKKLPEEYSDCMKDTTSAHTLIAAQYSLARPINHRVMGFCSWLSMPHIVCNRGEGEAPADTRGGGRGTTTWVHFTSLPAAVAAANAPCKSRKAAAEPCNSLAHMRTDICCPAVVRGTGNDDIAFPLAPRYPIRPESKSQRRSERLSRWSFCSAGPELRDCQWSFRSHG